MSNREQTPLNLDYQGETAARRPLVAVALTLVHPALGYLYVGRGRAALVATVAFTLAVAGFVTAWSTLKFFPVLPLVVLALGWLTVASLCLADIWHSVRRAGEYVLRPMNHPVVYALFALVFSALPAYLSYHVAMEVVWGVVEVNDHAMAPAIIPGDVLLIDRTAYWHTRPTRGDMVVVRGGSDEPNSAQVVVGRVIAVGGDEVKVEDSQLQVNAEALRHDRFETGDEERTFIERNGAATYLIAGKATAPPASTEEPITVADGNILVLGDNRRLAADGAAFATVASERVLGRPRYLLFSGDPASSTVRWDRIGYRVR